MWPGSRASRFCLKTGGWTAGGEIPPRHRRHPLETTHRRSLAHTVREPIGVTAHIVPWNAPLSMVCRSLAPALAAGNNAVIKPAEQTPLTALLFAEVFDALDFPAGVYNVVTGFGTEAGKALSEHPRIGSITFTGSVETGRAIIRHPRSTCSPSSSSSAASLPRSSSPVATWTAPRARS